MTNARLTALGLGLFAGFLVAALVALEHAR